MAIASRCGKQTEVTEGSIDFTEYTFASPITNLSGIVHRLLWMLEGKACRVCAWSSTSRSSLALTHGSGVAMIQSLFSVISPYLLTQEAFHFTLLHYDIRPLSQHSRILVTSPLRATRLRATSAHTIRSTNSSVT